MIPPSALLNRTFRRIWLASLVSGTAVAAHETAATWTMNLMSPSGLFISLMASLASLPFFLFTLPAGALADAFNQSRILRLANLWLAGCAGALAVLGWAGGLNPVLFLPGVFLFRVGFAFNAPSGAPLFPQAVTTKELRLDASSLGLVFASMGVGSVISAIFVIPWLRSRFATDTLMIIAQVTLAGVYILMAMVHHCLYCLVPMALAGAGWTLAASELWVIAQRSIPNSLRGRISALMMVLSQGAMTLGGVVWGVSAELTGTRVGLLAPASLFLI